jgi:hypothetical protein
MMLQQAAEKAPRTERRGRKRLLHELKICDLTFSARLILSVLFQLSSS